MSELVRLAQGGDTDAFGELYKLYYKEMYAYACTVTGNVTAAEDAVSEAICSALRQIKSLRNPDSFKGWLFKILNVCCRNQFNELNKNLELEENLTHSSYDGDIDNLELSLDLKNAIRILTEEEREIVMMKLIGEYKSREIAETLGLPDATVRSKLSRALIKLREHMTDDRKGGGE